RLKILSGFLILSMMLLLAGVWSIHQMNTIGSSVQRLLDDNYRSINAAKVMLEVLEREDSGVLFLLLGKWDEGRSIVNAGDIAFEENFKVAANNITIPGEEKLLETIRSCYDAYKALWIKPIVGTAKQGDLDWYTEQVHHSFLETKSKVNELVAMNDQEMYKVASDLKNRASRAVMPGIVAIISALIFSVIFSYIVNIFMITPMIRITEGIHAFINTRKPFDVTVKTQDEFGRLAEAIKNLSLMVKEGGGDS
ncbi:MAG: MCP four helix bundle domain-containing protein, partial [Planctomycetota bacterium]